MCSRSIEFEDFKICTSFYQKNVIVCFPLENKAYLCHTILMGLLHPVVQYLNQMITYEIQLRYVIRDKIQSKTKFRLRKNQRKIFLSEIIFVQRKLSGKNCLGFCLRLTVTKVSCLGQINAFHQ